MCGRDGQLTHIYSFLFVELKGDPNEFDLCESFSRCMCMLDVCDREKESAKVHKKKKK